MTDVLKDAPYEIVLRFNCEKGEPFGELRGCHRIMMSYLVDENGVITGRIDRGSENKATDFPADQLQAHLGEQFAGFLAQLEGAKATSAAAEQKLMQSAQDHQATQRELSEVQKRLETIAAIVTPAQGAS